jgi:hypothetical protein
MGFSVPTERLLLKVRATVEDAIATQRDLDDIIDKSKLRAVVHRHYAGVDPRPLFVWTAFILYASRSRSGAHRTAA